MKSRRHAPLRANTGAAHGSGKRVPASSNETNVHISACHSGDMAIRLWQFLYLGRKRPLGHRVSRGAPFSHAAHYGSGNAAAEFPLGRDRFVAPPSEPGRLPLGPATHDDTFPTH